MMLLYIEFIVYIKVDSSRFPILKLCSERCLYDKWLAKYRRVPSAFDSVGVNSKVQI